MPAIEDPRETAERAGLRYVEADEPGIVRRRRGRGFSYERPSGRAVSAAERERIEALAVPPAWTDVWICRDADGHIQACGRDDRGRKQYRYHDRWTSERDAEKFEHLASFGAGLSGLRRQVAEDLASRGMPRRRLLALVVRLLDDTLIRIGNPEYVENESYGLTTLEPRHVDIGRSAVTFEFTGKSGKEHVVDVEGRRLAAAVAACEELGGSRLFTYRDDDGGCHDVDPADINEYLRDLAGPEVSARDFRTWGGTVAVVEVLAPDPPPTEGDPAHAFLAAVDRAAERLGNTRAVCRSAYVHPAVEPAFTDGVLHEAWRRSRTTPTLSRAERTTLRLLDDEPGSGS